MRRMSITCALAFFAVVVHAQPSKAEIKVRKALAAGEPYPAIRACDHELGRETAAPVFLVLRADALNRIGRYERALEDARTALRTMVDDPEALLQKGIAFSALGPQDSAVKCLTRALDLAQSPGVVTEVLVQLATAEQRAQRPALALMVLEPPAGKLNRNDSDPRVFRLKGECEALAGDSASARRDLDRAVELAPRDPVTWNSRGYFRYALYNEHARAIQDYGRAIKLNPNYSFAFNNRGWSLYKLGEKDEALKNIDIARRKNPHNPYVFRNLGLIALEGGDVVTGCGYLSTALAEGFTARGGSEVEDLMKARCGDVPKAAPVIVPGNAPGKEPVNAPGTVPNKSNAP